MSCPRCIPAQTKALRIDDIRPDTPLRLDVAAALAYPDGSMSASGLRREAKRGRLVIERTAGKHYTTLAAIERMRELCRVPLKDHDSGCGQSATTAKGTMSLSGSSKTPDIRRAQAALQQTLLEQNARLSSTSTRNTKLAPQKRGTVIPLPSRLPTS